MKKFEGYEKGVNFGGWLSQCDHTKERYDTFITEADFEKVSKKFDHVRIPVDYELILKDDYSFYEEGFSYIDFAIKMPVISAWEAMIAAAVPSRTAKGRSISGSIRKKGLRSLT